MAKENIPQENEYTAKDIYVLKGLEPVRKRPGMYIGSTGPDGLHHLLFEVTDNSLDEALGGFANFIEVKILKGNIIEVTDNGRGIPVDIHPDTKKSALETVMTTLHAGGKFGGKVYKISGGLHGVGVSVVCALSKYMKAQVKRDGFIYEQEYSKGVPKGPVKKVGKCDPKDTGTKIIFEPDDEIFRDINFDLKRIITHLRYQAFLIPGIRIRIVDEREKPAKVYNFYFEGGVLSLLRYLIGDSKVLHENPFYAKGEKEEVEVEVAFQYAKEVEIQELSFANNIYNPEGGTHLTGFRTALTRTLNDYARKNGFLKEKDENFTGNDVREGIIAVVSVRIKDPQFEGQTKAKLGNPEAKTAVDQVVSQALENYLDKYPQDAKTIIENCLLAQRARKAANAARTTVLRKGILEGLSLPGKLADCSSRDPEESELFIVEGDSAGGSAKQGRDRRYQAILPLKGKILNVERARLDKMLSSDEIKSLIIALGTSIADDFDLNKLRYKKIILMADADSDGNHIKTLLLTLFYRYFRPIIEEGYLYIAQPPLYRIEANREIYYAWSDSQRDEIIEKLRKNNVKNIDVQRYKGLGEMNPEQLWETTMNPQKRVLLKVTIADAQKADHTFDVLMGKDVLPRKKFIQSYAKKVKNLDI
jgi:DNA gyrase subunit B